VRSYVGVAGGVAVAPVLGSRSTDTLSGLGPPRLRNGDLLPLGPPSGAGKAQVATSAGDGLATPPGTGSAQAATSAGDGPAMPPGAGSRATSLGPASDFDGVIVLPVRLGPRDRWFTAEAVETLLTTAYTVSPNSNRVGARLAGAVLARAAVGELPSEGMVLGAVQVPADGQPLIFLADHPTTGGYPVIAVVTDVTALAQARPGSTVRFHGPQR
jgi:allophanate hydrolase subunit 2